MISDAYLHYISHSPESAPADFGDLLDVMPKDPPELAAAVGGLVLHKAFVAPLGIVCPPESAEDFEIRNIPEILRRILAREAGPLSAARAPEKRFIGVCRHYALLACSVLRHHGVPSRLRVGFADYFTPDFYEDHWVTEYRHGDRWLLMDPELTPEIRRYFVISFDPCDVPRDRFVTAGPAWLGVRSGRIKPEKIGLSSLGLAGTWFAAHSLVHDLAVLNKREMLPWDYWGIARDLAPGVLLKEDTIARMDSLAALLAGEDPDWAALRSTYENDDAFRVPRTVVSYPYGIPVEVAVDL